MKNTIRNRLEGRVTEILRGTVMSQVDVETGAGPITSIVTTRSIDEVGLKLGDSVVAAVKATSVFLEKR
ncbi:MAG: TOBE domain-containing protein [Candidatus Methylophosphatis roskildensis]|jgi:molybdopterin-binding protein|uniref:TOBE domain-containing protein n=1 Tax=Candidatus Methylophosphatis roskildensis TaxID=2899263 RepID=A0A9D7E585_9PROT|nr:TOBE domain-containing protein [Candidatus Methylophosphatis roskildensis]MBK7236983.1 TOBE domain-containing protein [Sterolibacteriaceae bacterium]MBK7665697.1 TOBE domain-containing protein [Sterolibacteriaceae bacterium]MBK9085937.1 TOBE domain-containing protein [Sterolibacteriaceae bacterium]